MASLWRIFQHLKISKLFFSLLLLSTPFIIYLLYSLWPNSSFTNNSKSFYHTNILEKEKRAGSVEKQQSESDTSQKSLNIASDLTTGESDSHLEKGINILITFTKVKTNLNLQKKFETTVNSLLRFSSIPLKIHIIGDAESEDIAKTILERVSRPYSTKYQVVHLDVDNLAKQLHEIVRKMQSHFSYKPGAYYSDALFFLSIAIHRVMPETMHKVIMLDADLKFNADVSELYKHFSSFSSSNVMGIARDGQPVYRHTFSLYRSRNPGTRVGDPPPNGLTGFNSGVLLLDLDKMRKSTLYNSVIGAEAVQNLTQKFSFKGHLGDQDFFTLVSMEHEELFYVLPCSWNRQLCTWWKDKGYEGVFDQYFNCDGDIHIYHGNCNTPIPKLDWEK